MGQGAAGAIKIGSGHEERQVETLPLSVICNGWSGFGLEPVEWASRAQGVSRVRRSSNGRYSGPNRAEKASWSPGTAG